MGKIKHKSTDTCGLLIRHNDQLKQDFDIHAFIEEIANLTRDKAQCRQNIMFPATVTVDNSEGLSIDAHRKSWIISIKDLQYRRSLRKKIDYILNLAKEFIETHIDKKVKPTTVNTEHGNQIDGSIVLYEEGDYFHEHQDAAGLKYPTRSWTFLLYLMCPETGGNTIFSHSTANSVCQAGNYCAFRNYDSLTNQTHDAALHSAESVGKTKPIQMFASTQDSGKTPIDICKISLNIWFDEITAKKIPDENWSRLPVGKPFVSHNSHL